MGHTMTVGYLAAEQKNHTLQRGFFVETIGENCLHFTDVVDHWEDPHTSSMIDSNFKIGEYDESELGISEPG
jgi:hypothetical protein